MRLGVPKPDPLDCISRFKVEAENKGTLEFFLELGQREKQPKKEKEKGKETEKEEGKAKEEESHAHIHPQPLEQGLKPAIKLRGTIEYNDERKELRDIQDDPKAIRDTITASFVEERGRVAAEAVSVKK